jgi:hypothetical protein
VREIKEKKETLASERTPKKTAEHWNAFFLSVNSFFPRFSPRSLAF